MNRLPGTRSKRARRGISRVEVVVIVVVIAIALSIGLVLVSIPVARYGELETRDATQLKQIHAALATFSSVDRFDGEYPLPSRLVLWGREHSGEASEATGEDFTLNHSANIYSTLIMMNYLTPQILDDPLNGLFWDDSFVMHIHDPAVGANGSYAHMAAVGDRRKLYWRDTLDPTVPIIGTRAPARDFGPGHPAYARWAGNICFADNHVEQIENFYPTRSDYKSLDGASSPVPDNIYAADGEHPKGPQAAADAFLAIYISATEFTVEDVYDPLE
jgi:prepilin-type processing-associated H-X9-DG protein